MKHLRSLTALAAAGLAMLPLAALADDFEVEQTPAAPPPVYNNEVRIGLGWQSQDTPVLGRFTGLADKGLSGIAGFRIDYRDAWNSGGTTYYHAEGDNLGLTSRSINAEVGQQGIWGLYFNYDEIPYYQSDTYRGIYTGSNGVMIGGAAPGSITNVTTQAPNLLSPASPGVVRNIFVFGGKYQWQDWTISSSIKHEHKEGDQENSLAWIGTPSVVTGNGNITSSALSYFLQPINYDTDRFDINAVYGNTSRMQLLFGYTYNAFTDNNATWAGYNPFGFTSSVTPTSGSAANLAASSNVRASYTLPPSNSAQQVKAQFGYNLTPTTRINANLQYGLMQQNATYTPSTGNANFTPIGPPSSSFDGMIETFFGNFAITAHPLANLDVRAAYTLDDRQNLSSREGFRQYINDAYTANPSILMNLPSSYTANKGNLEVGYRILPKTRLTVDYTYDTIHRTYSNTNDTTDSQVAATIRSAVLDDVTTSLRYLHQDRWAGEYNPGAAFALLGLPTTRDYYGFYDYYLASRRRDEMKATVDYAPGPESPFLRLPGLTISMQGKFDYDYYPTSALGLKSNNNISIGPDISYEPSDEWSFHAFYTYQQLFFNTNSLVTNAVCNGTGTTLTPGPGCTSNGTWNQKTDDQTNTFGATVEWRPIPDKLKFVLDYSLSYGNTSYTFADGGIYSFPTSATNPTPVATSGLYIQALPSTSGVLNSISLKAEYKFRPNISVIGGYAFERFTYKDYAYGVGATQFSNAIFTGDAKPNYSVSVVGVALAMRW
jgi:MtrB/PioB family decaheme-associated outer membrane protein